MASTSIAAAKAAEDENSHAARVLAVLLGKIVNVRVELEVLPVSLFGASPLPDHLLHAADGFRPLSGLQAERGREVGIGVGVDGDHRPAGIRQRPG